MRIHISVPPHSAFLLSAARLPVLAMALGLAAASPAPVRAQDPAPQTPPAQPAPQPDAPQPGAAQQTPALQSPAPLSPPQPDPTQAPAPTTQQPPIVTVTTIVRPNQAGTTSSGQTQSGQSQSGPVPSDSESILESELRTLLVGKPLFLRGCYTFDDLRFNERGGLYDYSPRGSFTLSGVQIERLRLTKKELILEGDRYGYRFLGALPGNNPTDDMERIKITPKKKVLRIRIEREQVVLPKKEKEKPAKPGQSDTAPKPPADAKTLSAPDTVSAAPDSATAPAAGPDDADSAKIRPLKDEPTTTSPEHAVARLKEALARLFTPTLDDRFVGSMPPFWQLYYKRLAAKTDYHPSDPSVLRQNQVDKKARLVSSIDPPSNAVAQEYGVAGQALYHVVVGPDGKPGEIAIGQPIGFGLDENAVDTLKKASFEPATKDGKPVPVALDLIVQFHIYSKLTSGTSKPETETKPALPGPYSLPPKQ